MAGGGSVRSAICVHPGPRRTRQGHLHTLLLSGHICDEGSKMSRLSGRWRYADPGYLVAHRALHAHALGRRRRLWWVSMGRGFPIGHRFFASAEHLSEDQEKKSYTNKHKQTLPMRQTRWHLAQYRSFHPECTLEQCMQRASKTYRSTASNALAVMRYQIADAVAETGMVYIKALHVSDDASSVYCNVQMVLPEPTGEVQYVIPVYAGPLNTQIRDALQAAGVKTLPAGLNSFRFTVSSAPLHGFSGRVEHAMRIVRDVLEQYYIVTDRPNNPLGPVYALADHQTKNKARRTIAMVDKTTADHALGERLTTFHGAR